MEVHFNIQSSQTWQSFIQTGCWTSGELCLRTQYVVVRRSCSQRPPPSCVQANEPTCKGEWRSPVQGFRKDYDDDDDDNMYFCIINSVLETQRKRRKWRSWQTERWGQCSPTPNLCYHPPKTAGLPQSFFWGLVSRRENLWKETLPLFCLSLLFDCGLCHNDWLLPLLLRCLFWNGAVTVMFQLLCISSFHLKEAQAKLKASQTYSSCIQLWTQGENPKPSVYL